MRNSSKERERSGMRNGRSFAMHAERPEKGMEESEEEEEEAKKSNNFNDSIANT